MGGLLGAVNKETTHQPRSSHVQCGYAHVGVTGLPYFLTRNESKDRGVKSIFPFTRVPSIFCIFLFTRVPYVRVPIYFLIHSPCLKDVVPCVPEKLEDFASLIPGKEAGRAMAWVGLDSDLKPWFL